MELKSLRTTTINLKDKYQFSPIIGFDMRGISLNITFGVIFGGKRTAGDEAYSMMLENNFKQDFWEEASKMEMGNNDWRGYFLCSAFVLEATIG